MQRIDFPSPSVIATTERINAWLCDAETASSRPRKRRRHSNSECPCPMERSRQYSPSKRPRVDCDEPITPTQSRLVSVAGSITSVTSLTEKTTLSVRSSASRSSSPQRQITQLRTAHPPIFLRPSCAVAILGNDTSLPSLDMSSIQGVLRVARLYGNLIEYAADEDVETGYWGAFLSPVLGSLADGVRGSS
ncbi:hypothetical protein GQ44DRAFT_145275 [Phaeosphaeriaceae sp. PMI808]|nr:hypothetical protein GQ44DRAFT_145275 [Phaeosphaeriaceae sp. PMI808]